MNTKLTLSIEQQTIERAKLYANKKGKSLSHIIENYLKFLTVEDDTDEIKLTPIVKSLKGSFKAPKDFDYKKELGSEIFKKHM